jgi:DNA processing protein
MLVGENSLNSGHVGVMPGGINMVYPPSSMGLYQTIINSNTSCLISCQPYNQEAKRTLFPLRNRLIAAISDGIIVTEAKLKSGSLQTAEFAFQYKKPVFVVPGHPFDQNYEGNNSLLVKPGFIPLYMNTDVEKEMKEFRNKLFGSDLFSDNDYVEVGADNINMHSANNNELKKSILSLISLTPLSIGHINHYLNKPFPEVISTCILMEIEGTIIINSNMTIVKALDPIFLNNLED